MWHLQRRNSSPPLWRFPDKGLPVILLLQGFNAAASIEWEAHAIIIPQD